MRRCKHTYFATAGDQYLLHGELSFVVDAIEVEDVERRRDTEVADDFVDVQNLLVWVWLGRYRCGQYWGETVQEKSMFPFMVCRLRE